MSHTPTAPNSTIQNIRARQVLDSRGFPTVEADITLASGAVGRAAVPSGASTGSKEALELRDGGQDWAGKGVAKAVAAVNTTIAENLNNNAYDQAALDDTLCALDGTTNKAILGANALLAVSMAFLRAQAAENAAPLYQHIARIAELSAPSLPVPMINILNGGAHADNPLDVQEFMIAPKGFDNFHDALHAATQIFHALKTLLKQRGESTAVGDEGGFAPHLTSDAAAIEAVLEAIVKAGFRPGREVSLALDVAASECYADGRYRLAGNEYTSDGMVALLADWCRQYPIFSIEDGLDEADHAGWQALTKELGGRVQLVGDDLFVTNPGIFKAGIEAGLANAILVKVNQIGTISETLAAMRLAREHGYAAIVSHRSGETEDTTIADLAVGTGCGQIKTGALSRSDRVAKYNQLIRIAEQMGDGAPYGATRGAA